MAATKTLAQMNYPAASWRRSEGSDENYSKGVIPNVLMDQFDLAWIPDRSIRE